MNVTKRAVLFAKSDFYRTCEVAGSHLAASRIPLRIFWVLHLCKLSAGPNHPNQDPCMPFVLPCPRARAHLFGSTLALSLLFSLYCFLFPNSLFPALSLPFLISYFLKRTGKNASFFIELSYHYSGALPLQSKSFLEHSCFSFQFSCPGCSNMIFSRLDRWCTHRTHEIVIWRHNKRWMFVPYRGFQI